MKLKLRIFLSSGQTVIIKCKSYEIDRLSVSKGNRELAIKGNDREWTIDLNEIVAFTAKRVLF